MDNVGIVVESLDDAISFFVELGLELEGRATIDGDWAGRVTGLRGQRVEMAMLRTPDGHGRIEHGAQVVDEVVGYRACIGSATSGAPRHPDRAGRATRLTPLRPVWTPGLVLVREPDELRLESAHP